MVRRLVGPVFFLVVSGVCSGQQQPSPTAVHDTVVVTATGAEQPADQVAAASTVITAKEIRAAGTASLADMLRGVPGVILLRSGLDNNVTSLFVRGTSSTQTLVLFDGVRLNSPFFGGYDWSLPLGVGLDRVEVVRGPYSALYGADALGGVVQLIPARADGNRLRTFLEGGSHDWRRGEVEATASAGSWDFVAAGATRDGSGTLANDDFSSRTGMLELATTLGDKARAGVLFHRSTSYTEVPLSGAVVTPHRFTAAAENLAALPLHWKLTGGGELEVVLSRVERDMRYRDPDDSSGFVRSDTAADSDSARLAVRRRLGAHRLTAGVEWRRDAVTDGSNFGPNLDGNRLITRSAFAQDGLSLGRGVELLAGLRWDDANPWGSELSPRATVSWQGAELRGWASAGRAFRAPSLGELYYPFSGNPALKPERSRAGEVGVALALAGGASLLQFVGFSNREDDLIDFDLAAFRFANVARARQDGVEASWIATLGQRGRLNLALTWLDARDGAGLQLLRRPRWSGAVTVVAPLRGDLEGSASVVWVGERPDVDATTLARVRQGGFVTANVAVRFALSSALAVRARVENLAGRSYDEVRGYPAPGRRLMLGLETVLE